MATPQGPYYKLLGLKIRKARLAANLTQHQLASAIGLTRTSVTNIEKGRQPVYLHVTARLAQTLRVTVGDLLPESATLDPNIEAKLVGYPSPQKDWIARVMQPEQENK